MNNVLIYNMTNDFSEKIIKKSEKAIEEYSEMSALRSAINGIPLIGGPIDVFLSSEGQKIVNNRLKVLIDCLKFEIKQIDETKINDDFLESEEFFDLVVATFEKASKERNKKKISIYAKIMKQTLFTENVSDSIEYMNILSEISLEQFIVISIIYEQQIQNSNENFESPLKFVKASGWDKLPEIVSNKGINKDDLSFILKRLERTGLITEIVGMYFGYNGEVYMITPTLRRIMTLLQEND